jgi:hypothetical protein
VPRYCAGSFIKRGADSGQLAWPYRGVTVRFCGIKKRHEIFSVAGFSAIGVMSETGLA